MIIEFEDGIGYATVEDEDDLEDFAFEYGHRFVMWNPRANEPTNGDEWAVAERIFQSTVQWIRGEEDIPTRESHRIYKLLSRESFNEIYLSERNLKRSGKWKPAGKIEDEANRGDSER